VRLEHPVDLPLAHQVRVLAAGPLPVRELREPSELERDVDALLDRPLEPLLPHRHVEARLSERVLERAEHVPVERLRRHRVAVLVEVLRGRRPSELVPQLAEKADQVGRLREAARNEARLALRLVPASEVLDNRLRVHARLGVRLELAHRRRASQALGRGAQLPEDLLVRVALADSGLELRQRGRVDSPRRGAAFLGHSKKNRSD